ncbi:hypothetical protein DPMN_190344 [Dreissena polymorpha]|uniref:Uncharacterized protein n=1 Tax=Dreissena polymorpha TaxID=45954 RepID=A0A9D4DUH8_DREPO|nr:hypothetical protein DPMN_190344 [Dreissena polymorpha]
MFTLDVISADLRAACSCSFIEPVSKVLEFTAGAIHDTNVISKARVTDGSATDGNKGVVVLEGLLHYLLSEMLTSKQAYRI